MPAPVKFPLPKKCSPHCGRPCLLTPECEAVLLKAVEQGMPLKHAAMLAGISYDTLNRWRRRGRLECAPPEFRKFCKALEHSEAVAMQVNLARIQAAGEKDWRAAAWILERRHPAEFGVPQRTDREKPETSPEDEQRHEVLRRLSQQKAMRDVAFRFADILLEQKRQKVEAEQAAQRTRNIRLRE